MAESNGRIEYIREDLQLLRQEMREGFERLEEKLAAGLEDHEVRIRRLENKAAWITGAAAAVSGVVSFLVSSIRRGY